MAGQRIFVTGANGFLGSHLVDTLLARGDEVTCLVRRTSDLRWLEEKPIQLVYGDVAQGDTSWWDGLVGQNIVFHSAGAIKAKSREDFYRVNGEGTRSIVQGCLTKNRSLKRFVLISSIAAHGPVAAGNGMEESGTCEPVSHYGRSKLVGEKILMEEGKDLPCTIIRPAIIYGPRDLQLLPFFQAASYRLRPRFGLTTRQVNMVYVDDVVACCLAASESPAAVGEIFNAGGADNPTLNRAARTFSEAVGKPRSFPLWIPMPAFYVVGAASEIIARLTGGIPFLPWDKTREFLQRRWTVNVKKARHELGHAPQVGLLAGSRKTVDWYRQQGHL